MVSKEMLELGEKRSCIRELFEFGRQRAAVVGKENVFDFSLGNPCVPAPPEVNAAIRDLVKTSDSLSLHGYTSAPGCDEVREAIALDLSARTGRKLSKRNFYMTCGAAAALTACFKAFTVNSESEIIVFTPYFPEYKCFIESAGAKFVPVAADYDEFQINFTALSHALTPNTQAVVVNSPNNPSGAVYTRRTLRRLAAMLLQAQEDFGHPIYLISDEPYRELVYDGVEVPFIPDFYKETIICYSYSKSLSLPGERIGYMFVCDDMEDFDDVCGATVGSMRAMGYVCAPALLQRVIARCAGVRPNLAVYKANRDLLYSRLTEMGYQCVKPNGAFYLFIKAPGGNASDFSHAAKHEHLLIVPGDDFGCPDYLRISYCVDTKTIEHALPIFEKLIKHF